MESRGHVREEDLPQDLFGGVTPRLIYRLAQNPMNGEVDILKLKEIGELTLDQIHIAVSKIEEFRGPGQKNFEGPGVGIFADEDGYVKARTDKGETIKLRASGGKSLARQLMERKAAREAAEKEAEGPKETLRERRIRLREEEARQKKRERKRKRQKK